MYIDPNLLTLSAATVRRIADILKGWRIDRVYGFNVGRQVLAHGGWAIEQSAQRYVGLLAEDR